MNRADRARRLAAAAVQRTADHADSYDNAPPRRPMHGHTADCPQRHHGPLRRCRFCRAEALEHHRVNGTPITQPSVLTGDARTAPPRRDPIRQPPPSPPRPAQPELRACRGDRCARPTDHPSRLCDRCQPKETTSA